MNHTFVQAGLVEPFDQFEWLSFVFHDGLLNESSELLGNFVTEETKSSDGRLVVWNYGVPLELAASKRVKVIARVHRLVHIPHQFSSYVTVVLGIFT